MMKFTLGTWGFFKNSCKEDINSFLPFAVANGICNLDTALVYGEQSAEKAIGTLIGNPGTPECLITTKIPGKLKPFPGCTLNDVYTIDWMDQCLEKSIANLGKIDTLLLHNWSSAFTPQESTALLKHLNSYKEKGKCKNVGISLPNHFAENPAIEVLELCDTFMVPYNMDNAWGLKTASFLKSCDKHVMMRSLLGDFTESPTALMEIAERLKMIEWADEAVIGTTDRKHLLELLSLF